MEIKPDAIRIPTIAFQRILFATDFSQPSMLALRYASSLAHRYGAKMYLLTVVEPVSFQLAGPGALNEAIGLARKDIRSLQDKLDEQAFEIETEGLVRSGNVVGQILRIARSEHIDLLGVGTHGSTGALHRLLGSTAQQIFQQSPVPVLLVGPHLNPDSWSEPAKHILFPTDLSTASTYALPWAISLAQKYSAKLTVLHVLSPGARGIIEGLHLEHTDIQQSIRKLFEGIEHVPYELTILYGPAAEQILTFAWEHKCDRIVFGIRQRHTSWERFLSSIGYQILCGATSPILSVREGTTMNPFQTK